MARRQASRSTVSTIAAPGVAAQSSASARRCGHGCKLRVRSRRGDRPVRPIAGSVAKPAAPGACGRARSAFQRAAARARARGPALPRRLLLGPGPRTCSARPRARWRSRWSATSIPRSSRCSTTCRPCCAACSARERARRCRSPPPAARAWRRASSTCSSPATRVVIGVRACSASAWRGGARARRARHARRDRAGHGRSTPARWPTAIARVRPRVVAFVHAETSTGVAPAGRGRSRARRARARRAARARLRHVARRAAARASTPGASTPPTAARRSVCPARPGSRP